MRRLLAQLFLLIGLLTLTPGWCGALEVSLQRIDANGIGESIGSVTAQDTDQGLVIYPDLAGLSPCLLYTSPSPRDMRRSRMPSSA